jgi:tetratricopeptide (TPR) repeat protein
VITVLLAMSVVALGVAVGSFLHVQKRENDRIRGKLQIGEQALFAAQSAVAGRQWDEVRSIAARVKSGIEKEADERFFSLKVRAQSLDEQAQRERAAEDKAERVRAQMGHVQAQLRDFRDHRDEAKFLDTRFGGLDPGDVLEATCREARASLAAFGSGAGGDLWTLPALPAQLTARECDEVTNGFYELLLILADAVSQLPGAKRAEQALSIVNRAKLVRSGATRAFHLRRSAYLETTGDREGAARERNEADRLAPADAFDFFLMGRDLAIKGDSKAAISSFAAATQLEPDYFWAQCLLAICHLQTKQPSKARLGLDACLQQKRDCVWLYLLRGIASAEEGKRYRELARSLREPSGPLMARATEHFEAAEQDYRMAFTLLGSSPSSEGLRYVLLNNRGHIRLEQGDLAAATSDLEAATRLNDRRFEAISGLAFVFERQGRTSDALDQFAKAIQLKPESPELHRARADLLLGLQNAAADLHNVALSDLEDGIRGLSPVRRNAILDDLETAFHYEKPRSPWIAIDRTKQAALFHVDHRDDEALAACNAALKTASHLSLAHLLRIHVLLDLKRHDALLEACNDALGEIDPTAELYELRAIARDGLNDNSGAIADYTQSLSLQPANPRVLKRRGWSYVADDSFRAAFRDFDQVSRLAPKDADAFAGRGLALARLGQPDRAVSDAEQALRLDQKSARVASNAARVYAQAAVAVDTQSRKTGPVADRIVRDYLDRAYVLSRLALKRTPAQLRSLFLHQTLQTDPALKPIKRQLDSLENFKFDQP